MIKIELTDIKSYKNLIAVMLIIAGLYNIGYWSTFRINILVYLDISGIITSFIFPFLFTVGIVLTALIFTDFFSSALYKIPYGGYKGDRSKKYKIISFIVYTILTTAIVFFIVFTGIEAWLICSFLGWAIYSVFLINHLINKQIIAHEKFTINVVQLSLLVIVLSFSVGKYNSLKIRKNIEFDYIINDNESKENSKIKKFIGKAGEHYFFSPIDNSSRIIISQDKLKFIEIYHFNSEKINSKIDSTIIDIIKNKNYRP